MIHSSKNGTVRTVPFFVSRYAFFFTGIQTSL